MSYTIKEIFYTLQGEGFYSGRPAVFCRFSGCNLWSGLEKDRIRAQCSFCDTDFVGTGPEGGRFSSAKSLAQAIAECWPIRNGNAAKGYPFVVCTGGEPLLQLDQVLVETLHQQGFEIAVETNGTLYPPHHIDWICVSPKGQVPLRITRGDELKLVYPQTNNHPKLFEHLDFTHFYLQPKDDMSAQQNLQVCIAYCQKHPQWKLSLQTHKLIGIR